MKEVEVKERNVTKNTVDGLKFMLDYAECQEANEKKHCGDCTQEPQPCIKCWWLSCIDWLKSAIALMERVDEEKLFKMLPKEWACNGKKEGKLPKVIAKYTTQAIVKYLKGEA